MAASTATSRTGKYGRTTEELLRTHTLKTQSKVAKVTDVRAEVQLKTGSVP
jgi:hypothetical protein